MGKKRRYIQRARKFAKKAFKFLDKLDGNAADGAIEEYDAFIDTIVVTDNENQTVDIAGRVLGNVEGLDANPALRLVQYSRDGGANWTDGPQISDDSSVGSDRFTYTISDIGQLPGTPFSVGANDIMVRAKGVTDAQRDKAVSFTVRENKIVLGGLDTAFTDDGSQNITFDASAMTVVSGKQIAGSADAVSFANPSSNGFKIEVLDAEGAPVSLTGAVTSITIAQNVNLTDNSQDITTLLASAVTADTTFTVKVTPLDSSDEELTASAITQTVSVAGP